MTSAVAIGIMYEFEDTKLQSAAAGALGVKDVVECYLHGSWVEELERKLKSKDKNEDYCRALRIIDESYGKPGISVNVFAETSDILPHVVACGDVVLLCNVVEILEGFALMKSRSASVSLDH
ncbi:hypothetical protein K1719_039532 [Acacia pycnantha]|nr:hypothetical protein K1719_039532 [Acacia pycnantha]